jgi:hypothetical protein
MKKYDEDYEKKVEAEENGNKFMVLESLKQKYKKLRHEQREKDQKEPAEGKEEPKNETLKDVVADINEDCLSDLNPDEIPNSEISDVEMEDESNRIEPTGETQESTQISTS